MLILKNSLSWMIRRLVFMYEKVVMIEQVNASISLLLSHLCCTPHQKWP